MTSVEDNLSEEEVEADSFTHDLSINEAGVSADDVKEVSQRLRNILLNLTTGEANAVVRRCQGHQGLLAWKKLHEKLNPRTLASGVKAISQVLCPAKITNPNKADVHIEAWEEKVAK